MSEAERDRERRLAAADAEAEQRTARRIQLLTLFIVVFPAVTAVVLIVVGVVQRGGESSAPAASLAAVETFEITSQEHVQEPVEYPQQPPVGGPHASVWQNCGFYDQQVPSETAVHSLEHGAVWLAYDPALPARQVHALRELTQQQTYLLVTPFEGLDAPLVASAWGRQLTLEGPNDPRLDLFVQEFRMGSQTPEPGAPCTGGFGEPAA